MITYLLDKFYITINQSYDSTNRHIVTRQVDREGNNVLPFPPQLDIVTSGGANDVDGIAAGTDPSNPQHGWLFRLDSASNRVQWDTYGDGVWNIGTGLPTLLNFTAVNNHTAVALAYHKQQIYIVFKPTTGAMRVQKYNIGIEETTSQKYRERSLEEDGAPINFPANDTIVDVVYLAGGLSALVEKSSPAEYVIRWYDLSTSPLTTLPQVEREVTASTFQSHINTRDNNAAGNTPGITIDDDHNYVIDDGSGNLHQYPYAIPLKTEYPTKLNVQSDEHHLYYTAVDRHGRYERRRLDAAFQEPTTPITVDTEETTEIIYNANTFANDAEFTRYLRETGRFYPEDPEGDAEDRVFKIQTHAGGRDIRQAHRKTKHEWTLSEQWEYFASTTPPKDIAYVEAAGYPEYHCLYDNYIDVYKDPGVEDHLQTQLSYWGRVNLPRTFESNHLVVFDSHYYILDRENNQVVALEMEDPRDAQGDLKGTIPEVDVVSGKSFDLFPLNSSPDGFSRDISKNGWYIGNLDPSAIFLYDIDRQLPVWNRDAQYIFKQDASADIDTITIDGDYVTGPGPITLSVQGTKPTWLTVTGTALGSTTLTGTFPDTNENRITLTARNNDGSVSKTFYFRKLNPPVWKSNRQYQYLLVTPYELDLNVEDFVTWPNTNIYAQNDPPVEITSGTPVGTPPSWLTFNNRGRLQGTTPSTKTHDTVTFRAENSEGHEDKTFKFDTGKLYALDFGGHKPRGQILQIRSLDNGSFTTTYNNFAPTTTGNWRSLAAYNGFLWTINNATNQLTRINIRGTNAVTTVGSAIGTGDWQGLVFYDDHFWSIDADTNRLYKFKADATGVTQVGTIELHDTGRFDSLAVLGGNLYTILNRIYISPGVGRRRMIPGRPGALPPQRGQASLYRLNPDNAARTVIGNLERFHIALGRHLNWRSLTTIGNTLYALDNLYDYLWSIDHRDASPTRLLEITPAPLGLQGLTVLEDPP